MSDPDSYRDGCRMSNVRKERGYYIAKQLKVLYLKRLRINKVAEMVKVKHPASF